jgi:hypothetical protein
MKLHVTDATDSSFKAGKGAVTVNAFDGMNLYEEVEAMIHTIQSVMDAQPDVIMTTCMALMARCTEIWIQLLHVEKTERKAKAFRTMQLQKIMDLIDFEFKGASRLIEVARQEVELSR